VSGAVAFYLVGKRGRWLTGWSRSGKVRAEWYEDLGICCQFITLARAQTAAANFKGEVFVMRPEPLHGAGFAPPRMARIRSPR